jgi:hypothetical protein
MRNLRFRISIWNKRCPFKLLTPSGMLVELVCWFKFDWLRYLQPIYPGTLNTWTFHSPVARAVCPQPLGWQAAKLADAFHAAGIALPPVRLPCSISRPTG